MALYYSFFVYLGRRVASRFCEIFKDMTDVPYGMGVPNWSMGMILALLTLFYLLYCCRKGAIDILALTKACLIGFLLLDRF